MTSKRARDEGGGIEKEPSRLKKKEHKLVLKKEPSDTTQIVCWNVQSLLSANSEKHDFAFRRYIEEEDAHIVALTEVVDKGFETHRDFQFLHPLYPYRYWAQKTAVLSKYEPLNVSYGFPRGKELPPAEGAARLITLEFKSVFVVATYVPNSGHNFSSLDRRRAWNKDFELHIRELDDTKEVIWTGDFNVVRKHEPAKDCPDLTRGETVIGKLPGTHAEEFAAFEALLGQQPELWNPRRPGRKFVDVWRLLHPDAREYTHQTIAFGRWRLDGFIVSERLLWRVRDCKIRHEVNDKLLKDSTQRYKAPASDHWPVWLSLEMTAEEF